VGLTYVGKTMDTMDPKKEVSSDDIVCVELTRLCGFSVPGRR
jgi:hypothetical protein